MPAEKKIDEIISSDNIFEDFVSDESLWKEIKTIDKQQQKDLYHYLRISSTFLKKSNILFLILVAWFESYSYIQKCKDLKEYRVLYSICNIVFWEERQDPRTCFWV